MEENAANALLQLSLPAKQHPKIKELCRSNTPELPEMKEYEDPLPPSLRQRLEELRAKILTFCKKKKRPKNLTKLLVYDREMQGLINEGEVLKIEVDFWMARRGSRSNSQSSD
jgi:hypothetical protein